MQKESIVQIFAAGTSDNCLAAFISAGFSSKILLSAPEILVRISAAAAFVKVTIRSLSISTGLFSSVISFITLSTRTAVLPEPAAAETSTFLFLALIALCCCFVHSGNSTPPSKFLLLLYRHIPAFHVFQSFFC